jgi:tyrosyl-tRNA synthetase
VRPSVKDLSGEVERQLGRMRAGADVFVGESDLRDRLATALREGKPLRVKLGMDPSTPDLHLGHTITLEKLRVFQELGHTPIFLVGDFTARIGDPTGRKKTRPALDAEEVRRNAATYVEQVRKILDVDRAEVRYNSEWMDRMSPADFVRLCSRYTVARLLERDDFAKRHREGVPIFVHELLYPLVQGYDSVALEADVELGGSDQLFNLLVGRELQRDYGQTPQAVMTHPLLVGTDGREKMSKSLGNTIGLTDAPADMYGRVMSIPDVLMSDWIRLLAAEGWPQLEAAAGVGSADPLASKQALAASIVERFHGPRAALDAADHFRRVVQRREVPDDVPVVQVAVSVGGTAGLLDVLRTALAVPSNAEARRLIAQGAVELDGARITDPTLRLEPGSHLIRAGRRRVARIEVDVALKIPTGNGCEPPDRT